MKMRVYARPGCAIGRVMRLENRRLRKRLVGLNPTVSAYWPASKNVNHGRTSSTASCIAGAMLVTGRKLLIGRAMCLWRTNRVPDVSTDGSDHWPLDATRAVGGRIVACLVGTPDVTELQHA
jgi:hypothetical protein